MKLLPFIALFAMVGCASTEEKQAHNEAQIRMIAVQREAQTRDRAAEAEAQKALYEALSDVAKADPSQAGVVAMALAFQGMQGGNNETGTPIVQLQARQNEALQWTQALAPVAGSVISTIGTAAISANVQKSQINATRDVQINQANQTANAIASVANLGATAVANTGDSIGGDLYNLQDSTIDNSQTTTTTTATSTVTDSYNTTDASTINNDYSSVTYEGQEFTLPNLLNYLAGTGLAYNIQIGDTVYTIDGDGDPVTIDCGVPDFSPTPPVCSGG
jgi:hypothetical protein